MPQVDLEAAQLAKHFGVWSLTALIEQILNECSVNCTPSRNDRRKRIVIDQPVAADGLRLAIRITL